MDGVSFNAKLHRIFLFITYGVFLVFLFGFTGLRTVQEKHTSSVNSSAIEGKRIKRACINETASVKRKRWACGEVFDNVKNRGDNGAYTTTTTTTTTPTTSTTLASSTTTRYTSTASVSSSPISTANGKTMATSEFSIFDSILLSARTLMAITSSLPTSPPREATLTVKNNFTSTPPLRRRSTLHTPPTSEKRQPPKTAMPFTTTVMPSMLSSLTAVSTTATTQTQNSSKLTDGPILTPAIDLINFSSTDSSSIWTFKPMEPQSTQILSSVRQIKSFSNQSETPTTTSPAAKTAMTTTKTTTSQTTTVTTPTVTLSYKHLRSTVRPTSSSTDTLSTRAATQVSSLTQHRLTIHTTDTAPVEGFFDLTMNVVIVLIFGVVTILGIAGLAYVIYASHKEDTNH